MLKTACFLTGENFALLVAETPASKKKVIAMALAMLVPTLIWCFNGFMLSYIVLESGLLCSILTALLCGIIVFFIEKLIIMANGNWVLTLFRILIGLIVAILGSLAIDEVVFKKDIGHSVADLKKETIEKTRTEAAGEFNSLNQVQKLDSEIQVAQVKYDVAVREAVSETEGSSGSGKSGYGKIAEYKNKIAEKRKQELSLLHNKQQHLEAQKEMWVQAAANKSESNFDENALLIRIKALFRLVVQDRYMLWTYIFFTALMFFFEFLVVILKLTWKKTNYERKIEMIEEIGKKRLEFLNGVQSPLSDPGNYLPYFEPTKKSLNKKSSLFN